MTVHRAICFEMSHLRLERLICAFDCIATHSQGLDFGEKALDTLVHNQVTRGVVDALSLISRV